MNQYLTFLFLVHCGVCSSQLTLFNKLCSDSLISIDYSMPINVNESGFHLAPNESSMDELSIVCANKLKKLCSTKYNELRYSKMLQQMANFASLSWKGSGYSNQKKWASLEKRFKRIKRRTITGFNIVKCISFRIPLTESKSKQVYFDNEDSTSEFHLFYGKKLTKKEIEEGKTPVSVVELSRNELEKKFISHLKRNGVYNDICKGVYSSIGISIKIDENTLKKNTLPTARVVLFLGSKRLQRLKINE